MNRKLIIKISLMVFALITVCSITLAANSYVPNTDENSSKNDEQTKIVDIEKLKETQIKYDGEDQNLTTISNGGLLMPPPGACY